MTGTRMQLTTAVEEYLTDLRRIRSSGGNFVVLAGWGHSSALTARSCRARRAVQRAYTPDERAALDSALPSAVHYKPRRDKTSGTL